MHGRELPHQAIGLIARRESANCGKICALKSGNTLLENPEAA
jgi:hypothetical protein